MNTEWEKVKEIFDLALEQPEGARQKFLIKACGADKNLFAEVQSLLEAYDEPENLIEKNALNFNQGPNSKKDVSPSYRLPFSASQLKGDLDNIVLTALRKEPARRYASAAEFAEDISKYLKGLPVSARPNTLKYRAEKFFKRNRISVIAVGLILLSLLGGVLATIWQARVAAHERDQAQQARAKAEHLNIFLQNTLSAASPEEKGKDAKVIEVLNDAVQNIDNEFPNQPDLKAQALLTIGQTYIQLGLVDEAEKTLRQALELSTELYGEENKATVSCLAHLGQAVLDKANFEEAEQLLTKAIEVERKLSPAGSKELAFGLSVLGECSVRKREIEKAKPMLQESVTMYDQILGKNNPDSAFVLISLGRAQAFSDDLIAAEATYRQSVAIYRQLPPRYAVRLATALLNLGYLLANKGNYDEGIKLMREADNIFVQKQGESFSSFESKAYLGLAYFTKNDYAQTITQGIQTIEIGRRLKLEAAPDFIATLQNVGLALTRTGKAKAGEIYLRESLERIKKSSSPEIASVEGALGECLFVQRRYGEAGPLLRESYEILKNSKGEQNPRTSLAKSRLEKFEQATQK